MIKTLTMSGMVKLVMVIGLMVSFQPVMASQEPANGFGTTFQTDTETLSLTGVGVLKYLGFIRIYNGAFYLPQGVKGKDALLDVPKRLEVAYLRSFKAEDFGTATIAGMRKNVDPDTFIRLESRINEHNRLYPDIQNGDRVSLTYIPSVGTEVAVNGVARGIIPGADFAKALFSLWLGDKPFDASFKRALLGSG